MNSEPSIEDFSELLPDGEEALGFDDDEDDVPILPPTLTLCPTHFWRLMFPSGIKV